MENPLVTVACTTYNHEKYIIQTIEGFLSQKTEFPIEIIIHDDASTDRTVEIIQEYADRYPELIFTVLQRENQYSKGKKPFINFVFPRVKGKYIALCEGDDYWTDPLKLQKQVDFLEKNPDYVITYHNAMIIDENGGIISTSKLPDKLKKDFSCDELIRGNMILTLTMCFRNILKEFPDELFKVHNGDKFLTSLLGNFGKGKFMPEIADAVYRKHSESIWSELNKLEQIFENGNTRAWLHRYYKRIGQDQHAEFFKDETIKHFKRVLKRIADTDGRQHVKLIDTIFSQYRDIIDSASEESLRKLLNNSDLLHIYRNNVDHQPLIDVKSINKYLVSLLEEKAWQHKAGRYADCFESVTFQNHVESPAVSIIVISWRLHPDNLKNFQILDKHRDQNYELIFVDNGGENGEFDPLKPFIDTYVRLNTNTGAYLARNIGSVFAKAPILIFLEDDGIPEHNFVESHLRMHSKYDLIAVRGVYSPKTDTPLNKLASHYYLGDLPYPYPSNLEGNCSYRADVFYAVGGWDDDIVFGYGGRELSIRLLDVEPDQRKQIYSPDPVIYHDFATNEGHLAEKERKQESSLQRLRKKYSHWDSVTNSWNKYIRRYDLLILRDIPYDTGEIERSMSEGRHAEAINYLNGILSDRPQDASVHNIMGIVFLHKGEKESALEHFKAAVRLEPQNPTYQKNMAGVYVNLNKLKEAISIYRLVAKSYPEDIDSLMALASFCNLMGRPDEALQFWEAIVRLEPENIVAAQKLLEDDPHRFDNIGKTKSLLKTKTCIASIGKGPLSDVLRLYEDSKIDKAERFLENYINHLKEAIA